MSSNVGFGKFQQWGEDRPDIMDLLLRKTRVQMAQARVEFTVLQKGRVIPFDVWHKRSVPLDVIYKFIYNYTNGKEQNIGYKNKYGYYIAQKTESGEYRLLT